ncbi:TIGR03862 family flavoprotein [Pseudooceanicola sp. CBS1P-1]|uniref:TIGR03862 family flavoprotein n=1 Tax=Pseudooceanicola albus TaxID=2692189 RepID=A0A6L7FZB2_9RHOB|nr:MULTISPECIES: TIGR03862 family flavoprotein [Pseudooceanicola]MBT9383990.1 TIGR03862 family flavoprotein [Pseudooceanicola endophyticus]MXN16598.1 TIGR03862 family flavoprotein [Pseudooceanicola albus]
MQVEALVIGGGPAGLMAAESLGRAGRSVVLAERMPSLGRKFLMAGKSGLNLTKEEPFDAFLGAYGADGDWLRPMLESFGPQETRLWAEGLGQEMFTGSTGRVFPVGMKASPLLRAWLGRLRDLGVVARTRWDWQGWQDGAAVFATPEGLQHVSAQVTLLAMGGASWPRLGSDGGWARHLDGVAPFTPANCGFHVAWSQHMAPQFGVPVKAVALRAGAQETRGEFVLSRAGVEGGAIYTLSKALREGAPLELDLLPDLSEAEVARRLAATRRAESLSNRLRKALKLDPVKRALLQECGRPVPEAPEALARRLKRLALPLGAPFDIETAISTAGGLTRAAVDAGLMLRDRPGVFAAGEMLDWEAPTGGYLLTACLATGLWAGQQAEAYLRKM